MKMRPIIAVVGIAFFASACKNDGVEPGTYVDLNTGDSVTVVADPTTGYAINSTTKKPVYLYVDNNRDTIFTTGQRVNNMIIPIADGKYEIDGAKVKVDDAEVKIKYEDYKKKYDGDSYTIKDGDYKVKVEGDGDTKIKDGDYKKKIEKDGDIKIKTDDTKTKIEKDGEVTVKKRTKIL